MMNEDVQLPQGKQLKPARRERRNAQANLLQGFSEAELEELAAVVMFAPNVVFIPRPAVAYGVDVPAEPNNQEEASKRPRLA